MYPAPWYCNPIWFIFITGSQPALKARVNLDTQVQTDPRLKQIELSPLNLKLSQIEAEGVTGDIGLAGHGWQPSRW